MPVEVGHAFVNSILSRFGLFAQPRFPFAPATRLRIRWPSGQIDQLRSVPLDHILLVEEGKGITQVIEARKKLAK